VCYSVLQYVAVCCSMLQCVAVSCSALQCVTVCCSVLQCAAVCCSVLQCGAVKWPIRMFILRIILRVTLSLCAQSFFGDSLHETKNRNHFPRARAREIGSNHSSHYSRSRARARAIILRIFIFCIVLRICSLSRARAHSLFGERVHKRKYGVASVRRID